MATLVEASWLAERLGAPGMLVLDPRRPMKYLQGHFKGAVNLPLAKIFDSNGRLLPISDLAQVFSFAGLDDATSPVVYDSYDGQGGAMLAWVLEYLGRTDVAVLQVFFEAWVAEGREMFYRPVAPQPGRFIARVKPEVRAGLEEVRACLPSSQALRAKRTQVSLVDLRSEAEFSGLEDTGLRPGHIPGAVNIVWKELLGQEHNLLYSRERLRQRLAAAGIGRNDRLIAYCRMGPRASVGYLALQQLGYDVRLYDGSYAQWSAAGMPVEVSTPESPTNLQAGQILRE